MVKRTVVWTVTAARQRREILIYWNKRNGSTYYSRKLIQLIARHIQVIVNQPESFKSTIYPDTRESAMGHFSIFYKMTEENLIITAFWDNRQDPKVLLQILK